ncbi:hypothetical protein LIZ76_05510 [Caldibacillus sp. 210928-DFI.2.22]|uniref:hypothetical protein n=1 Tax=unclassified Caldibacillus TaxID=2641266 RepID=UPI001D060393|nr:MULTISPECIES: hypothetical protein [unclassified Caldibacillus]MCB7069425.1 hypothetical protein [Caldibacillus sp. 210928-DFI.2.22]
MATRLISRHRFLVKTAIFWRRGRISSPFFGENRYFLATSPVLVVVLSRKPPIFLKTIPFLVANFVLIKDSCISSLINQVKLILVTESIMLK